MESVELQLHFVGGTVLTIPADRDTAKDVLDGLARRDTSACTIVHGCWIWTFPYDKVVVVGCKNTPPRSARDPEQR